MRLHGIRAKTVRRYKVTTHSRSGQAIASDLVHRNFTTDTPNRVWTTDITYIWTREGWTYLAVVLDLFSRMIVGWELSSRLTASLVTSAMNRAISWRKPDEGLILHSDRGSQYASDDFVELAKEHRFQRSMGRTGSCYDNAVTESFFHTLKTEHINFYRYETRLDARTSIFDYIEVFYNRQRKLRAFVASLLKLCVSSDLNPVFNEILVICRLENVILQGAGKNKKAPRFTTGAFAFIETTCNQKATKICQNFCLRVSTKHDHGRHYR